MSEKDTYHKLFNSEEQPPPSAKELEDYLQNRLSPEAQHEFEQRLLDSPMLEDGLEGWQWRKSKDVQTITNSLNRRVRQRVQRGRTTGKFAFWQLAAAVLLLVVAGVVFFGVLNQIGQQPEMAMKQEQEAPQVEEQRSGFSLQEDETETAAEDAQTMNEESEATRESPTQTKQSEEVRPPLLPEEEEDVEIEEEVPLVRQKEKKEELPVVQTEEADIKPKRELPTRRQEVPLADLSRARLEDALAETPNDPDLKLEIAQRYYAEDQAQLAMQYLSKLPPDTTADYFPAAYLLKAKIWLHHAEDTAKALKALQWLKENAPEQRAEAAQELQKLEKK